MPDLIDRTATQVRSFNRNPHVVHDMLATIRTPDGRAHRTACHRDLPSGQAALTAEPANCADCRAAAWGGEGW